MITYGYSVKENEDPYVELVDGAVSGLNETVVPGAFLVDIIPSCESCPLDPAPPEMLTAATISSCLSVLHPNKSAMLTPLSLFFFHLPRPSLFPIVRYVPDWFPGTGWKAKAKLLKKLCDDMVGVPFQFVKDQMVS